MNFHGLALFSALAASDGENSPAHRQDGKLHAMEQPASPRSTTADAQDLPSQQQRVDLAMPPQAPCVLGAVPCVTGPVQRPRIRDHARETDFKLALELLQATLHRLSDGTVYADTPERKERVLLRLLDLIRAEVKSERTPTPTASIDAVITDRLRSTLASFKEKKKYSSSTGREHLHILLQALADPAKEPETDQENLKALCKRLVLAPDTVGKCWQERYSHGFGYVTPRKKRSDATEEWLIEVGCLYVVLMQAVTFASRYFY